jgi:FKBP-type peptidyl-prolyl cis-trans isomerase FkpA
MQIRYFLLIILIFTTLSCNNQRQGLPVVSKPDNDKMVDVNKYLVQKDNERIENYITRKNIEMDQTSSGLWYTIIKEGSGDFFTDGNTVSVEYESSLLDGTLCYSSEKTGPKEIIIGKSDIESGLNEGLKLLKPGSEALFILPPYLAYGLLGDGNLIPARSVIVIRVKVLNKD